MNRTTHALIIVFCSLLMSTNQLAAQDQQSEEARRLVRKLSSHDVEMRDEAMSRLAGMGETVRKAVAEASQSSDPELARRATAILKCLEWGISLSLARMDPWIGGRLSSSDFEQQCAAIGTLLEYRSEQTPIVLRRLVAEPKTDPRTVRAAAVAIARLGVEDRAEPDPVEPLSAEELKKLKQHPEVAVINRAFVVMTGHGKGIDRLVALSVLNDVTGGKICSIKKSDVVIPAPLLGPLIEEASVRWIAWWRTNRRLFGSTGDEYMLEKTPKPITELDVLVQAMLDDPGEAELDEAGRVIGKRAAEQTRLSYDEHGGIDKRSSTGERIWKYTYDNHYSDRLISRTIPDGSRVLYSYDEKGFLAGIRYTLGRGQWHLQLVKGRVRELVGPNSALIEFPGAE